jgi:hypothetical protein
MATLDQHAGYLIKIQGSVDSSFFDWFGPFEIASTVEEGEQTVTTLSGFITDQAGLVGLIRHLHGLGFVLLSIERMAAQL